ncbi:glycosyltransferase [Leptolyngbya sp. FACHB-261]|uniref:glycosyltransferase n=1 Tax=Leptolyngbya sp. FACHB-261 TaxID=2692806 RepID=UPI001688D152|nr:glycosyltransferase [Leptolyngbya sp. FACHB-261]MBD2099619.1 glycosyltransferase [Leptolyngbya sp. FACHB-261]
MNRSRAFAKTAIITGRTLPHVCGVGDYSVNLASHLYREVGLSAKLLVEQGCDSATEPFHILPYVDNWSQNGLDKLLDLLESEKIQTVILQYTPWLYSPKGFNLELARFWQQCSQRFQTLLIAHETYSWFIKYPGTWLLGIWQQYVLRHLVRSSHHVFCGSEVYLQRLKRFSQADQKFHYLPIPSNIPLESISTEQREVLRQSLGIEKSQAVLALFGCRGSVWQDWVLRLDQGLKNSTYSVVWLLLGSAQSVQTANQNSVLRFKYLSQRDLSHYLQISNLFLMPHEFGLSAKRTSLMSALEHGLPVVGTDGNLTDPFLRQLPSVSLVEDGNYSAFEQSVLTALECLPEMHRSAQDSQAYYYKHLDWSVVIQTLLPYLQSRA